MSLRGILLLILSIATMAQAQDGVPLNIKEGLWEVKTSMSLEGAKMPQIPASVLEKLPAEKREKMAQMMGQGHGPIVIKECITKEKLAKYQAFNSKHKECTHHLVKASPSKYEATFTCDMKDSKSSGTMVVEAIDPEHSRGSVKSNSEHAGKNFAANMTFESRYLGPSCGDVK